MKRLLKYQSLLWVLLIVASGGNFLHAQDMEEKAIGEANYSFDTETNKSRIETNGNKKDVKQARKQARKEEREKRRQARSAKRQESNGDYRGNPPYGYRRSYFHGYGYLYYGCY